MISQSEEHDLTSWKAQAVRDCDGKGHTEGITFQKDEIVSIYYHPKQQRQQFFQFILFVLPLVQVEINFEAGENWYYGSNKGGEVGMIPSAYVMFVSQE